MMPDLPINTFVLDQDTRDIIERERDLARWYYEDRKALSMRAQESHEEYLRRLKALIERYANEQTA